MKTTPPPATASPLRIVAGIDVGGAAKGFHAVALDGAAILSIERFGNAGGAAAWCSRLGAAAVGIDAPSGWSMTGGSRLAERSLSVNGQRISCFMTPTRQRAAQSRFFDWVFRGEELFHALAPRHRRYNGGLSPAPPVMFETFPHGIVCARAGHVIPAAPKLATRTQTLRAAGIDAACLPSIDFVDAALCALAAQALMSRTFRVFGQAGEGFIVLPTPR